MRSLRVSKESKEIDDDQVKSGGRREKGGSSSMSGGDRTRDVSLQSRIVDHGSRRGAKRSGRHEKEKDRTL